MGVRAPLTIAISVVFDMMYMESKVRDDQTFEFISRKRRAATEGDETGVRLQLLSSLRRVLFFVHVLQGGPRHAGYHRSIAGDRLQCHRSGFLVDIDDIENTALSFGGHAVVFAGNASLSSHEPSLGGLRQSCQMAANDCCTVP